MFDTLRAWLNGKREYSPGVTIFTDLQGDPRLVKLFSRGKTPYNEARLRDELMKSYRALQAKKKPDEKRECKPPQILAQKKEAKTAPATSIEKKIAKTSAADENSDAYKRAKNAADKVYKEAMNTRAQLFLLANVENWEAENTPDRINAREPLAIRTLKLHLQASRLYDHADYAKNNDRIPDIGENEEGTAYSSLPEHMIKNELDNARKAFNKLKAKEANPSRLVRMENHQKNILILEEKWHLLNSRPPVAT